MNCGTCKFSGKAPDGDGGVSDDIALCRRHAPRAGIDLDHKHAGDQEVVGVGFAAWPVVAKVDWCGDFEGHYPT